MARKAAANSRVRVAVLGVNGRGEDHIAGIQSVKEAEVVALCDPDLAVARKRAEEFQEKYGRKPQVIQDLRKVFDDKNIDAVTIATPNHWHSLAAIWACQAGKDVYVEKPGSHNIFEGRKMVEAAKKYNRIVQHGVQLRSSEALQEGVQLLRAGKIGTVYMARGLVFRWRAGPLQLALALGLRQWRRRQSRHSRNRHVHVGSRR
jgi:predicted dehydrogenase